MRKKKISDREVFFDLTVSHPRSASNLLESAEKLRKSPNFVFFFLCKKALA